MIAYQVDTYGNVFLEEEPAGPYKPRIKEIIHNSLNQNGYSFTWMQNNNLPYQGTLTDGETNIDLLIYAWRISNEGNGRRNLHGKRIQIASEDRSGFDRPITASQKTLLLGVYERDNGHPIIAAWDVEKNRHHGKNKSCFVQTDAFSSALREGIIKDQDSDGNSVYVFTDDYLTAYVEQVQHDASLAFDLPVTPPGTPDPTLGDKVRITARKKRKVREVRNVEALVTRIGNLTETERNTVVKQRIGQGYFKELLRDKYEEKCCICNLDIPSMLIGSHIKGWAQSTNSEKLDVNNGLLLCSHHDALFDKNLISFSDTGEIIISDTINDENRRILGLTPDIAITVTEEMKPYLRWHRDRLL